MTNGHGTAGLDENTVEPDDDRRVFVGRLQWCIEKATSAVGDRLQESVRRDSQEWSRAPSSTDKRLATELPIVKSRATEGEADLRWIERALPDCRLPHQARIEKV